jgi:hypothetical protein
MVGTKVVVFKTSRKKLTKLQRQKFGKHVKLRHNE